MPELFVRYGPADKLIDRGDMNFRADIVEGLLRSSLAEGLTTTQGIVVRKPKSLVPQGPFIAFVTKDGGVAGDDTTNTSLTYRIDSFNGDKLVDAATPLMPRFVKTTYAIPPADSYALCAYDENGDILLLWVPKEFPDDTAC